MTTRIRVVVLVLLSVGFLPACSRPQSARVRAGGRTHGEAMVTVAAARVAPVPRQIRTFGTVQSMNTVSIRAQVTDILLTVDFRKGQEVKKGQRLFTIDDRSYRAAVEQAEANLARDRALAASARRDADRDEALLKKGIAAPTDYDKSRASSDALAATLQADQAALDSARVVLEHCTILSPVDGRIGDVTVTPGNLVKADDTELAVIHQIRPIEVFFSVPQADLPMIRKYMARASMAVEATIPNDAGGPERGVLTFVDNSVSTQTGTIRLGADFENRSERLWPGLYVEVVLTLAVDTDSVVVPTPALMAGRDGQYVFVVRPDSSVEVRPVKVDRTAGAVAVIRSGIRAGERVVTDGQLKLTQGTRVRIEVQRNGPGGPTVLSTADRSTPGTKTVRGGSGS